MHGAHLRVYIYIYVGACRNNRAREHLYRAVFLLCESKACGCAKSMAQKTTQKNNFDENRHQPGEEEVYHPRRGNVPTTIFGRAGGIMSYSFTRYTFGTKYIKKRCTWSLSMCVCLWFRSIHCEHQPTPFVRSGCTTRVRGHTKGRLRRMLVFRQTLLFFVSHGSTTVNLDSRRTRPNPQTTSGEKNTGQGVLTRGTHGERSKLKYPCPLSPADASV